MRFKDLCLDAVDPAVVAPFWAGVLDREVEVQDDGLAVLRGTRPEETIWINPVSEPKTVKNRVHFDVNTVAIKDLVAAGATVVDRDSFAWTVLRDPAGNEFCGFERSAAELAERGRFYELNVDSNDSAAIAAWWAARFGTTTGRDEEDVYSWLDPAGGLPWPVVFVTVPEPKTVKNRIHWDVLGSTPDLVAAGATLVRARDDEIDWDVLADPEGNEFCVFASRD